MSQNQQAIDELKRRIEETAIIKRDMTELLRQLESQVTKKPVEKPGSWRHHPTDWNGQNPI